MTSIYRTGVWFMHGWWNYGRSAYDRASKTFNPADLEVNLANKVAVVTGANSGLGLETSYELAKRGAKVYMLCRDEAKGLAAVESLKGREDVNNSSSGSNLVDRLIVKKVDVSLQDNIKSFVKGFEEDHLDILVNNAGCMVDGRPMTSEGIELNFATNVMGPYLMTEGLIPKLSEGSVVLTVTSGGMLTQKLEPRDIQMTKTGKGIDIYAQNKVKPNKKI